MQGQQPGTSNDERLPSELRGAYSCDQDLSWDELELPFPDADNVDDIVANVLHKLGYNR